MLIDEKERRDERVTYFVSCTVDGFIAAEDGSVDALVDDGDYFAELFEEYPETCPGHLHETLGVTGENRHFSTPS
jgi:hypothetical protein